MWRLRSVPALFFLSVSLVLAGHAATEKERVARITSNLTCTCGCAHLTVASCGCGQATEMIEEVTTFVRAGRSDVQIYQAFEKKYGPAVLGAPKLQGFNILAWVLPFVGLGFGAVIVVVVVRRLHPKNREPETDQLPVEIDEKYRRLLEEELNDE
jgi:cytochrome c-type biogenesis protein CcmH